MGDYRTTAIASSIVARSDHPVSKAIAESAKENNVELLDGDEFTAIPGQGVSGVIGGQKWYLGNHHMVEDLKKCSAKLEKQIFALTFMGMATMWMAVFADVGAALVVVANGLRAMRK